MISSLKVRVMKYFCLNCKKEVDTYMNIFMGFKLCCKECRMDRIIQMEELNEKEFKSLSENFKEHNKLSDLDESED
jgi:DNA-directed RNA polymerase subunit RPC12/RpoP